MTPERWQQIDYLFHAALDHEPGQRLAFVANACNGDEALRKEIESLISAHEESGDFIEQPATDLAADLFAQPRAELIPGLMLGPYRIGSLVAVGGMGEVYVADDTRLNRKVALKLLPPHFKLNPERVRRFEQEARAASALNHPNIITIHDICQWQGYDFIATEFIDGKTLRELIGHGEMRIEEVLDITIQLASALRAAHEAGIVHRDIKPENIMVRRDGLVKVLDFGLAKLASEESVNLSVADTDSLVDTNPGTIMGTAHYMSPEQARGDELDSRTDIWSLGAVVYEMLTTHPPSIPPSRYRELPPALERIVLKALSKDRERRYQTMSELLHDLRDFRESRSPLLLRRYKTTALVTLATIIIAAVVASLGLYKSSNNERAAFTNIEFAKVAIPRQVYVGRISPDGKYILYVSSWPNQQSLWLKEAGAENDVQLVAPASVNYWAMQFSPDSKFVYYLVEDNNNPVGGVLYRLSIVDGTPEKLFTHLASFVISPDGRQLAFKRGSSVSDQIQLLTANLDGSNERVVMQGTGTLFWSFDWAPDGKSIAYIAGIPRGEAMDWYVAAVPSAGGAPQRITQPSNRRLRSLASMPDGQHLLLIVDGDDPTDIAQLWLLSRADGAMRRVTHDLNQYQYISVSAGGRQILATMRSRPAQLWVASTRDTRQARLLMPDITGFDHITWTPDGALVAAEALSLWEIKAETGERHRLTSNGWAAYPVVTSEGRYVVFALTSSAGLLNLWRMDRDGSNAVQLTTEGGTFPAVSADRQWVYYTNTRYGHTGVWRVPLAGGTPERIVDALAYKAAVSPDGNFIAYAEQEPQTSEERIVVKPVVGGPPVKVFHNTSIGYGNLRWSSDGLALLFVNANTGDLELLPLAGGPAQTLLQHDAEELFAFDLSPDGKRLAYTKGTLTSTLVLISDVK